jgi:hypothetical protein
MAHYTSWESFVKSGLRILHQVPADFYIEKGVLMFTVTDPDSGVKYFCSGSHGDVGSIDFNPSLPLNVQCDFDSFWMFESENSSNELCNW